MTIIAKYNWPDWVCENFIFTIDGTDYKADEISYLTAQILDNEQGLANKIINIDGNDIPLVVASILCLEKLNMHLCLNRDTKAKANIIRKNNTLTFSHTTASGASQVSLFTSGTTGKAKQIHHTINSLLGGIKQTTTIKNLAKEQCWLLSYSPSSYAGLQMVLNTLSTGAHLTNTPSNAITHLSTTPSAWRVLMLKKEFPLLKSLTFGGEAVDQALLDRSKKLYPNAKIQHIFAASEVGVLFSVKDGYAGFPSVWLDKEINGITIKLSDNNTLAVKSNRAMIDAPKWFITNDILEIKGERTYIVGRKDSIINVGGFNVNPEKIELYFLELNGVHEVYAYPKKNPITGNIIAIDVIANSLSERKQLLSQINTHAAKLEAAERPRIINFVEKIEMNNSSKKARS
jgi:acyl-coenzyme A synthetase/AMP-(fatty) acid ligase